MNESRLIQLIEYAHITTDTTAVEGPKLGVVSKFTFDWLVELSQRQSQPEKVLEVSGDRQLRLGSMVGYMQSPDGTGIEVLPKTGFQVDKPERTRAVLQKMLGSDFSVSRKEYQSASLQTLDTPIHEWIFSMFLHELEQLLKRGLRFQYERIEGQERFIRGQLNIVKQMRQTPAKATEFNISYDLFSPNRLENRLIKTALICVLNACKEAENWRSANEFSHYFDEIPTIEKPLMLLGNWEQSKALKHYQSIYPWCELILKNLNPAFVKGMYQGIALMFPMERLFESYVTRVLERSTIRGAELKSQASSQSLVVHAPVDDDQPKKWFQLRPDLLLTVNQQVSVIDLKWKLLNRALSSGEDKYSIGQGDMYQLFAYGQKYQQGVGNMMLIYPKHMNFDTPLPSFHFDETLTLWVVPYCLETDCLIQGEWCEHFLGFTDCIISE